MTEPMSESLRERSRQVLEDHWDPERGWCVPNPATYPHLWLWDSCFHAIVWASLEDSRAVSELDAVLAGQLPGGMVPHMRYGGQPPDTWLGPLTNTSSLAQPPMFGHAARVLTDHGMWLSDTVLTRARRGLDWLWTNRRTADGLIFVVHPWEAGNDHGQRWDDWEAPRRAPELYRREVRTAWNKSLVHDLQFDDDGAARWSASFVVCPAAFNAYVAFNLRELAAVLDDTELTARADDLSSAIDAHLWDETQQLWVDLPVVGGGSSAGLPVSDGVMPALVTADSARARAALAQLDDPLRFGAPFGPANIIRGHPTYAPDVYWRGPAWPPLNYLFHLAQRRWGLTAQAGANTSRSARAAVVSNWAEYWNPESGTGLGASPQSWTGLVFAMSNQ